MTLFSGSEFDRYDAYRKRKAKKSREISVSGRDIGPLPDVVDPSRKAECSRSLRLFCEEYLSAAFNLGWSPDHLRVIERIERTSLEGGLYALAMPRGSGKTTICEAGALWSLAYGYQPFVVLLGATEAAAIEMLDSIKMHIESNDALFEDFPEVCYPVRAMEGIHQRANGQLLDGARTRIGWTTTEIILPTIAGSAASGNIVRVAGLTGRVRGMKHTRDDGTIVRPSLVLIDDPQTADSARSPTQCAHRERLINGDVLGLAGPKKKIAALMPCTVIVKDDLADRLLDHSRNSEWQGERAKMVYEFPTNKALWAEYARIREDSLRAGAGLKHATEFYIEHRAAMDEGARVAWEDRYNDDEASAIQHAMNLLLRDEATFWAERQNEPLAETAGADDLLSPEAIMAKVNGHKRGEVPLACTRLTAFIDVQGAALFWMVCAWEDNFTGHIIDYGVYPEQPIRPGVEFTLRDLRRTLADEHPGAGLEGQIYAGLKTLADRLLGRAWVSDGGSEMRIDRALIDSNWGESTDVVYQFCRQSEHAALLMPSRGVGVGASNKPFADYARKRGERVGLNWRIPLPTGKRSVRRVDYDANYWKSFVHARLAVAMGDPGCLAIYGTNSTTTHHRVLAKHLTAEYRVRTEGRGRSVDEWKVRVESADNHWLDCLVGCAVAASMGGSSVLADASAKRTSPTRSGKKRVSLAELQRKRREAQ